MATLTDTQLDAVFTAMQGGTPLMESVINMELDIQPMELRQQLVAKFTAPEFQRVMKDHVRPNMTPERRARMMVMRMVSMSPDSTQDIKATLQAYIDTL